MPTVRLAKVLGSPSTGTNTAGSPSTVWTASSETATTGSVDPLAATSARANIPGSSRRAGLGTSTRSLAVRVAGSSWGDTYETVPSNAWSPNAGTTIWAFAFSGISPSLASGTSANTQTVDRSAS